MITEAAPIRLNAFLIHGTLIVGNYNIVERLRWVKVALRTATIVWPSDKGRFGVVEPLKGLFVCFRHHIVILWSVGRCEDGKVKNIYMG